MQLRFSEVERQVQSSQKALQDKTEEWERENQLLKRWAGLGAGPGRVHVVNMQGWCTDICGEL